MFSGEQYGKAEEAIRFYVSLFPDSKVDYIERHGQGESVPAGELRRAGFSLAGRQFMATESRGEEGSAFTSAFSLYVDFASEDELTKVYTALSKGGKVHMPLRPYPSSQLFVLLEDRYGIFWQLEIPKVRSSKDAPSP